MVSNSEGRKWSSLMKHVMLQKWFQGSGDSKANPFSWNRRFPHCSYVYRKNAVCIEEICGRFRFRFRFKAGHEA
jgi:hypothetical protein